MSLPRLLAVNLLVAGLVVLLLLAGAEAWLRLTIPASSKESIFEYTLETKRYKVMRANASITAWGTELRTNSLGFRDREATVPARRPGELRIAVLGDSFTVSAGVEYEQIYTTRLERMLEARHDGVRVLNLAVAGYNVLQYERVLNEVALGLQPDLLLVAVFPTNDFSNETLEANRRRAHGEPEPPAAGFPRELYVWRAWLGRVEAKVQGFFAKPSPAGRGDGWRDNIEALGRIAGTARKHGVPVLVALLPHTWNLHDQRALHGRVQRYCAGRDIPVVDLLPAFIAAGVKEASLRLNALDSHPSELYNAVAARALAGYLVRPAQVPQAARVALPALTSPSP